jgi:hypothetical protein
MSCRRHSLLIHVFFKDKFFASFNIEGEELDSFLEEGSLSIPFAIYYLNSDFCEHDTRVQEIDMFRSSDMALCRIFDDDVESSFMGRQDSKFKLVFYGQPVRLKKTALAAEIMLATEFSFSFCASI